MLNRADITLALKVLKQQQDQLAGDPSDAFSNLLTKLFKVDTIPFMLYTVNGSIPYFVEGSEYTNIFKTFCFRIEEIDDLSKTAQVSLLKPFNVYGEAANDVNDVYFLKKSETKITINLNEFSFLKCLDIELLRREVIMEPKW